MVASLVALIALSQTPVVKAGRFEMGERLKLLDVAWVATPDVARRREAVKHIAEAVTGFFGGDPPKTCQELDLARAHLEGRVPGPEDAITARFASPICEPGASATLEIAWAYIPASSDEVIVAAAGTRTRLKPGVPGTLTFRVDAAVPDLKVTSEAGVLVPFRVNDRARSTYLSVIRHGKERIKALAQAANPIAKDLGELVQRFVDQPSRMETEMPLIQYVFLGERLEEGKVDLRDVEEIPYVKSENAVFRVAFPKSVVGKVGEPVNVVVALHGAGGSENMFFESYGRGMAVKEALKRGWVFMAPRSSAAAPQACLNWLQNERKLKLGKVFVMGHSMGGGIALFSGKLDPKPAALALFAPAAGSGSKSATQMPIYLAVGKQEIGMLRNSVLALMRDLSTRPDFKFEEFDPCEHLMVVADAVKPAFEFFDKYAN